MSGYRLLRDAENDLDEIQDYTVHMWGEDQARNYLTDLFTAFERLAREPSAGRRRHDLPVSLLALPVGSHVVVYRLAVDDHVEVLAVLHQAMDVAARIDEALRRARFRRPRS